MSRRLTIIAALCLACASCGQPAFAAPPRAAAQYQRYVTATAHATFGIQAPVATLAAQIAQESAWDAGAASWVGAQGLAQFMPATAADMARLHPDACAPANPLDARWAIRCQQRYMRDLTTAVAVPSECATWAFALSSYNGGLGWLRRDQAQCRAITGCKWTCSEYRWFYNVEVTPDHRRSAANIKQNRDYVNHILLSLTPEYTSWGRGVSCEGQ